MLAPSAILGHSCTSVSPGQIAPITVNENGRWPCAGLFWENVIAIHSGNDAVRARLILSQRAPLVMSTIALLGPFGAMNRGSVCRIRVISETPKKSSLNRRVARVQLCVYKSCFVTKCVVQPSGHCKGRLGQGQTAGIGTRRLPGWDLHMLFSTHRRQHTWAGRLSAGWHI